MAPIKPVKGNFFTRWLRGIWDYVESYLDNWFKKLLFLLAYIGVELLAAYLIAVLDVGLINLDLTISGMLKAYQAPNKQYPWTIFLIITLCITFFAALIIYKNGTPGDGRNFKISKSDVYGSAREISQRELRHVAEVTHKDSTLGTIIGQLDDTGKQVVAIKPNTLPNNNMLVFGPPGAGKSTSYVLTYITQAILRRQSVICTDTKGEVYAKTVEVARKHGYRVLRLDLKDPAHSDGWNVLKELRHDDVRALVFAQTVMASSSNQKDNFAAAQEALLQACCMYQERLPNLADSQRTFYNAFAMILQGATALDTTFTAAFNTYGECMQTVSEAYATFLNGSENLRSNIINGLVNRLRVLSSPPVRDMTSRDEIDFATIGKEPTILYISMSDQHQTMSFLASLAFSFAFQDLIDLADSNPSQQLDVPVHFVMEEFGNLGKVPNIHNYLSTARSRQVSINLVVQSLGQLNGIYEESMTNTILADCATWMALACNDRATSELLEWRSGEATVEVKTVQHDANEPAFRLSHQHSTGDGRRHVYSSNEIMKIKARKESFVVFQQLDSLLCLAFPIFQHHEFQAKNMPETSSISLIPLSNKKAKRLFREWEEQRIKSFNTWLANGGNPLKNYNGFHTTVGTGPASNEELPDIIPIHTLERMALAEAAGEVYDPTKDPDSPLYQPPAEEPAAPEESNDADMVAEEELLWDLTGITFEMAGAEDPAPEPEKDTPDTAPAQDTPSQKTEDEAEISAPQEPAKAQAYAQSKDEPTLEAFGELRPPRKKKEKERQRTIFESKGHNKLPPKEED